MERDYISADRVLDVCVKLGDLFENRESISHVQLVAIDPVFRDYEGGVDGIVKPLEYLLSRIDPVERRTLSLRRRRVPVVYGIESFSPGVIPI